MALSYVVDIDLLVLALPGDGSHQQERVAAR
jgi:hypothetical protein